VSQFDDHHPLHPLSHGAYIGHDKGLDPLKAYSIFC